MKDKNYLIITTMGKSGSYLLMSLLDWHPEVIVFPREENLIDQWLSIQRNVLCSSDSKINEKISPFQKLRHHDVMEYYTRNRLKPFDMSNEQSQKISKTDGIDYSNINYQALISQLTSSDAKHSRVSVTEWLDLLFEAYAGSVDKYRNANPKYSAFKTVMPNSFTRYTDILPNAKFIHLVRHPYDVLNAYKRNTIINKRLNYFRHDFDLLEHIIEKKLKPTIDNIDSTRCFSDRHYIIKYEDMVLNPKNEIMKLCNWLNISWNDDLAVPTIAGKPFMAYSDNRNVKHNGMINVKRIGAYKETLSNREIRLIDYLFHNSMKQLGYKTKYGASNRSLLCLALGLLFPLRLELKNWNAYTIFGMFFRRLYILHKVADKWVHKIIVRLAKIKAVLKRSIYKPAGQKEK